MIKKYSYWFFVLAFLSLEGAAQHKQTWTSFLSADSTMLGYKDVKQTIKIQPKFLEFGAPSKFDAIAAVSQAVDDGIISYYINKQGKIKGDYKIYIYDNTPDCESEGFIRFTDPQTQFVGMFDEKGKVVIPAHYNALSKVNNGLVVGLKGARKAYVNSSTEPADTHFSWSGGEYVLLDTNNKVLINNFSGDPALNLYSLATSQLPDNDPIQEQFVDSKGRYYSFINYDLEFEQWFKGDFLKELTLEKLIANAADSIAWEASSGWVISETQNWMKDYFNMLSVNFENIANGSVENFTSRGELNQFLYKGDEFEMYYTNCDQAKSWKYPTMTVVATLGEQHERVQNYFEFLRTDKGYKLIAVVLRG